MLNLLLKISQFGFKNFGKPIPRVLLRSDSYIEYLRVKNAVRLNHHISVNMLNPLLKISQFGFKNFGKLIPRVLLRSDSYIEYLRVKNAVRLNHHPFEIPDWVESIIWIGLTGGVVSFSGIFWYNVLKIMMGESDD